MKISHFSIYMSIIIAAGLFFLPQQSFAATTPTKRIGSITINKNLVKKYTDTNGNKYSLYKKPEITVITPKKFSFQFYQQWNSISSLIKNNTCTALLNWTYFGYAQGGGYFPAWVWYEYGSFVREPYQPATDKNLQVLLASNWTTIDTFDNDSFDFTKMIQQTNTASWYVNAGPWLVRNGVINNDIVRNRSHWQRETTRVGVVKNPDGTVHFLVATQPISLPQFIVFSHNAWIGSWSFQFVNLDGGSSTSLYTPYNSYQSRKILPSFICIQ